MPEMTEDDALNLLRLSTLKPNTDREDHHQDGDEIVSDALRTLGWSRLADAYDEAREDWWYS